MKLLSIDWDYFFPCPDGYDWGANEESALFYELVWIARSQMCLDEFVPVIPKDFWRIVTNRPLIVVADSHSFIYPVMKQLKDKYAVTSLDAHHDCGYIMEGALITYKSSDKKVDCANWRYVAHNLIKKFYLHYPEWRKEHNNEVKWMDPPTSVSYGLPKPAAYNVVFICRSSCWTPPWYDNLFQEFIQQSGFGMKIIQKSGWDLRNMDLDVARKLRERMDAAFASLPKP